MPKHEREPWEYGPPSTYKSRNKRPQYYKGKKLRWDQGLRAWVGQTETQRIEISQRRYKEDYEYNLHERDTEALRDMTRSGYWFDKGPGDGVDIMPSTND